MGKFNIDTELNDKAIVKEEVQSINNVKSNGSLKIKKKSKIKARAKATQFYLEDDVSIGIDKLCKQAGLTRNEMANTLLRFAITNAEIIE